ncbi:MULTISPECIES: ribonuclease inhibitor [unclassified Sphingobacterium]|uniref:ribonuclease inhibitor n=1 Tax=unclassified Sphingobacterium TaxID=2609468 RepID=UPI0025EEE7E5|nr:MULTISPECIES: ribonuclease inhibitor [unclassified Sphingobacterium]
MKNTVMIDGNNIHDICSFYEEINRVFMAGEDWKIACSLDAFNDLLYGGFGILHKLEHPRLIWTGIDKSKAALGYDATRAYYQQKIDAGPVFNTSFFEHKLAELREGKGQTYFDILLEIIADHPDISLEMKA